MTKLRKRGIEFIENFKKVLAKIAPNTSDIETLRFKLTPVSEPNKTRGQGGWTALLVYIFKHRDFETSTFNLEEPLIFLSQVNDRFPLWIHVYSSNGKIELKFSKRYRRFKELHHHDTGHPPFKIIQVN